MLRHCRWRMGQENPPITRERFMDALEKVSVPGEPPPDEANLEV